MSVLPDGAKVNEVEFNKTRAATHLNTLHLKEHAKFLVSPRRMHTTLVPRTLR